MGCGSESSKPFRPKKKGGEYVRCCCVKREEDGPGDENINLKAVLLKYDIKDFVMHNVSRYPYSDYKAFL